MFHDVRSVAFLALVHSHGAPSQSFGMRCRQLRIGIKQEEVKHGPFAADSPVYAANARFSTKGLALLMGGREHVAAHREIVLV